MFKRIKNLWELSKMETQVDPMKRIVTLFPTYEFNNEIPITGDGEAEFLGEGTSEEYEDQLKEDKGEKSWYDRIKKML